VGAEDLQGERVREDERLIEDLMCGSTECDTICRSGGYSFAQCLLTLSWEQTYEWWSIDLVLFDSVGCFGMERAPSVCASC